MNMIFVSVLFFVGGQDLAGVSVVGSQQAHRDIARAQMQARLHKEEADRMAGIIPKAYTKEQLDEINRTFGHPEKLSPTMVTKNGDKYRLYFGKDSDVDFIVTRVAGESIVINGSIIVTGVNPRGFKIGESADKLNGVDLICIKMPGKPEHFRPVVTKKKGAK